MQLHEPAEVTENRKQLFSSMRHNRLGQVTEALDGGFPVDDRDEKGEFDTTKSKRGGNPFHEMRIRERGVLLFFVLFLSSSVGSLFCPLARSFAHSLLNSSIATGNTLLFVACQNGLKNGAKMVLRYGADLNLKNYSGNTPLHYCFKYGHNGLGAYLIKKGADDTATNAEGLTVYEGLSSRDVA